MRTIITADRYHDFSCGHRVYGHESKCANLHGHNYRITFTLEAELDAVGRVLDFGVIKEVFCEWLEEHWDHRMLIWNKDPLADSLKELDETVVLVKFNPTAENMAEYLLDELGPVLLRVREYPDVRLVMVRVEETRKCSATAKRGGL